MQLEIKDLGAAIKRARLEKNFTQERLAEIINITPIHIKQLESGSRKPSVDVLYKLAKTLNMSIDEVFFPEKTDCKELIHKIQRGMSDCSEHELQVLYATLTAMKSNNIE
ncbi:MAG: helix-turn-helix transcriptional regulator [Phycisphaerales bacterium]|jgi:Predicted transcriptional regulators